MASSSPPATAYPSTAAITGLDSASRVGPIGPGSVLGHPVPVPAARAWRSAPAQNVPPPPVSTATEAESSASKAVNAVEQGVGGGRIHGVAPLRAGRW